MNGAETIAAERRRQVEEEGWTAEHDSLYVPRERFKNVTIVPLTDAAICYARAGRSAAIFTPENNNGVGASALHMGEDWPWEAAWWKPSDDPIRNLAKAGALIAAEIDRLQAQ